MIDERNDSTHLIDDPEFNLPAPHFDERSTANAQPVQPIPTRRVSTWPMKVSSLRRGITGKALGLVVIAGLATGALGGMAWVKEHQVNALSLPANESVSDVGPADSTNQEPRAEVFGITDLQSASRSTQIRKRRSRVRSSRAPRAYRVAVLRG